MIAPSAGFFDSIIEDISSVGISLSTSFEDNHMSLG